MNIKQVLYTLTLSTLFTGALVSCGDDSQSASSESAAKNETADSTKHQKVGKQLLEDINQQIIENPGSSNGFYRRAKYHAENQQLVEALDDIDRALQIDPDVDFLNYERAKILLTMNRFTDAELFAEKAVEINPENVDARILLGQLSYINGDYNTAFKHLDEALRLDKFNYEPYFIKGMVFEEIKDSLKAATSYQTAIEQNPEHFDSYFKLAGLYYNRKPDLAIQYLEQSVNVEPDNMTALRALAKVYVDQKHFEKGLQTINKMIALDEGYSESYFMKGQTYILMLPDNAPQHVTDTTYQQALSFLDKATELYPNYTMAYYLKGLCYEGLGEISKARDMHVKALDISPHYQPATEALRDLQ